MIDLAFVKRSYELGVKCGELAELGERPHPDTSEYYKRGFAIGQACKNGKNSKALYLLG